MIENAHLVDSLLDKVAPHFVVHLKEESHRHLAATAPNTFCINIKVKTLPVYLQTDFEKDNENRYPG
jgi:hypothetical protein